MDLPSYFSDFPPLVPTSEPSLPQIGDVAGFNALKPGAEFRDPQGAKRRKPWTVTDPASFDLVPEGESFIDPQGAMRVKPKYQAIGLGTQILYDMTSNDQERQNVLSHAYGAGNVKRTGKGELYVETPEGAFLKPGRGWQSAAGFAASTAAPVVGSIAGEVGGAAAGTLVAPGPGTLGGAVAGGAVGSAAGQAFNDMILSLAGSYSRGVGEEAGELGLQGLLGAGGTAVGRGVAAVAPSVRAGVRSFKDWLPSQLAYVLGAKEAPEATRRAVQLSSGGTLVRPSAWAVEAPYLKKVVEEFDPVFRQQDVLAQSATQFYEREAGRLLDTVGIPSAGREPLTAATKPVDVGPAGSAALGRVQADLAAADARVQAATDAAKATATTAAAGRQAEVESRLGIATAAEADARKTAQEAIDAGFTDMRETTDRAIAAVKADRHPGDLWRIAAEKLDAIHAGIEARAGKQYGVAHTLAGETPLIVSGVNREAKELIETLPLEFQNSFPTMVHQLERFRGNEPMTLEWAHNLRSLARQRVDRLIPYADRAEGINRKIAGMVNRMLHDPAQPAEIKAGVKVLDATDDFYSRNMRKFEQEAVDKIVKKMRAGFVDDAGALAELVFKPDSTVGRENVRRLLGPQLWKAVHAADVQQIVRSSRSITGELDAGAFARQVNQRLRDGVWTAEDISSKASRLAGEVLANQGKIPLRALPGDTVTTLLQRAVDYAAEAKQLAKENPLDLLSNELKRIDTEHKASLSQLRKEARDAPLGFLSAPDASQRIIEATTHILDRPDLLIAAARRFGETSPEFTMLRQAAAHRLLQTGLRETRTLGAKTAKMPEEVQRLLFPGMARDDLVELGRNMEFLIGPPRIADPGGSIAAAARVLHPVTGSLRLLKYVPGASLIADPIGRFVLSKYYSLVTYGVTHPAFIAYVAQGLKGPPAARAGAKAAVQQAMGWGGAIGAGIGAAVPGMVRDVTGEPRPQQQRPDWRHLDIQRGPRSWQRPRSEADEAIRRAAGGSP